MASVASKMLDGLQEQETDPLSNMQRSVQCLLQGIGESVHREGLRDTPKRVAKAFRDMTCGHNMTAKGVFGSAFFQISSQSGTTASCSTSAPDAVVVRDIDFASTLEDTLLPFYGRCHIAYLPHNGVVLGLSKFARLTRFCAKRLQSPQGLAEAITYNLLLHTKSAGIAVVITATELSYEQGLLQQRTLACVSGVFQEDPSAFQDVLVLLGLESLAKESIYPQPRACSVVLQSPSCCHSETESLTHVPSESSFLDDDMHLECSPSEGGTDSAEDIMCSAIEAEPVHHMKDQDAGLDNAVMENAVRQLLKSVGEDPYRKGVSDGVRRYVQSLHTSTRGYKMKMPLPSTPAQLAPHHRTAASAPACPRPEDVVCVCCRFVSQCEHHMLPFHGHCMVAYIPQGGVRLDADVVPQVVEMYACRLQVQERITQQVADALESLTGGGSVMVACSAAHMCMVSRGVESHATKTVSTVTRGAFADDVQLRRPVLRQVAQLEG